MRAILIFGILGLTACGSEPPSATISAITQAEEAPVPIVLQKVLFKNKGEEVSFFSQGEKSKYERFYREVTTSHTYESLNTYDIVGTGKTKLGFGYDTFFYDIPCESDPNTGKTIKYCRKCTTYYYDESRKEMFFGDQASESDIDGCFIRINWMVSYNRLF